MKVRSEFVSNSSSSSFIVSINHSLYSFSDFVFFIISEICRQYHKNNSNDSLSDLDELCDFNERVLNYHLNTTELMFLGTIYYGSEVITVSKSEDSYLYEDIEDSIITKTLDEDIKIIKHTNSEIIYEEPVCGCGISISKWLWFDFSCFTDEKDQVNTIIEYIKYVNSNIHQRMQGIYCITKSTINTTRLLLKHGYKIVLPDWVSSLDELETSIENGESIYYITQHDGGCGRSESSLYSQYDIVSPIENVNGVRLLKVD